MSDLRKASEALTEQDAITAGHLIIRATLETLDKALTKNSFNLRPFEAAVADAKAKAPGRLSQLQMNMNLLTMATLVGNCRDATDAAVMLVDRCKKGLDENAKLRARVAELEAQLGKKDGVLAHRPGETDHHVLAGR